MALLEAHGLTVTFGGLNANESIDLAVAEGSFVGLIGPNGAGKTTFIDAITGYVPISAGRATFAGTDISTLEPHELARAGLVRTFQSLELFEDLSVTDNLRVAAEPDRWSGLLRDALGLRSNGVEVNERVAWALELVGLTEARDAMPTDLSHGQRKLVGVARALAAGPKLVLLDEPAAGLDTAESQRLGRHLRQLLDHDMTVFLIDHDMGLVLSVCDYLYVLDFGRIIAQGTPAEIREDPAVIEAYLGETAGESQAASAAEVERLTE